MFGGQSRRHLVLEIADGGLTVGLGAVLAADLLGYLALPGGVPDALGLLFLVQLSLEADYWGRRIARWSVWRGHPADPWPVDEDS